MLEVQQTTLLVDLKYIDAVTSHVPRGLRQPSHILCDSPRKRSDKFELTINGRGQPWACRRAPPLPGGILCHGPVHPSLQHRSCAQRVWRLGMARGVRGVRRQQSAAFFGVCAPKRPSVGQGHYWQPAISRDCDARLGSQGEALRVQHVYIPSQSSEPLAGP